ncbi:hypothetical protein BVY01_01305, partial [bacterium I07]
MDDLQSKDPEARANAAKELTSFRPKNPGITEAQCDEVIRELTSPEFDRWGEEITSHFDALLKLVAREGGVEWGMPERLREKYPYYVPLLREMFEDVPSQKGFTRRGMASQAQAVQRAKGSDRSFQYYMDAWIKQTERFILWAQKARIMNAITSLAWLEGSMPLVKKTSPPQQVKTLQAGELVEILADMGFAFEEEDGAIQGPPGDRLVNLFFNETYYRGRHPIVAVWRNGKRQWYELHPTLFSWVQQVENEPLTGLAKLLAPFARGVRLGATGINPAFVFYRNFVRDSLERVIMSESGKAQPLQGVSGLLSELMRSKELPKALKAIGVDPEMANLYARSGGVVSTLAGFDRQKLEKLSTLVESKIEGKTLTFAARHPIEGLRLAFAAMENANRIPEFKSVYEKVLKETGDKEEAFIRA